MLCLQTWAASPAAYDAALSRLQSAAQAGNAAGVSAAARTVASVTTVERPGMSAQPVNNALLLTDTARATAEKSPKQRTVRLAQLAAQIAALRADLNRTPAAAKGPPPEELLRSELSGAAYGQDAVDPPSTSWLDKLSERFAAWLRRLFSHRGPTPTAPPISPQFIKGVLITVAAAAFALLVAALVQWLRRRPRRAAPLTGTEEELTLAEARDADALRTLADEQAARGDFRRAFRLMYLATLVALDTGGVLRFDRSRTNWEYLRALRAAGRDDVYEAMTPLTRAFDRVWYGFASADAGDYARARAQFDALQTASAPTAASVKG